MAPTYYPSMREIPERVWLGLSLAPLGSLAALIASVAIWLIAGGQPAVEVLGGVQHAAFFFALFGLPVAYLVSFGIGVPAYRALERLRMLRAWPVLIITVIAGALVMPLVWRSFLGGMTSWEIPLIGGIMGLAAGGTFAAVAIRKSPSRSAI